MASPTAGKSMAFMLPKNVRQMLYPENTINYRVELQRHEASRQSWLSWMATAGGYSSPSHLASTSPVTECLSPSRLAWSSAWARWPSCRCHCPCCWDDWTRWWCSPSRATCILGPRPCAAQVSRQPCDLTTELSRTACYVPCPWRADSEGRSCTMKHGG